MDLKIDKEKLFEIAQTAIKAVSNRSTLPILGGLLLKTENKKLTTYATDLEIAIRKTTEIDAGAEENIVVPARLFLEIAKNLPEGTVGLTTNTKDNRLEIISGSAHFSINTLPAEDYPKFPEMESPQTIKVKTKSLMGAIKEVSGSASRDESRPILTGILLVIGGTKIKLIATDSYRLATTELAPTTTVDAQRELVVPAKTLEVIVNMNPIDKEVEIRLTDNQAAFSFDGTVVSTKLIGGQYPDYRQLFPEKHEVKVDVGREELLGALRRTALMSYNNAPLRLSIAGGKIKVTTRAADVGEAKEEVGAQKEGPDIEIAFNARYLIDGVAGAEEDRVSMLLSDPLQPGMIKNKQEGRYKYLVMPIRLS